MSTNNYDWAELVLQCAKLPVGLNLCNVLRWMAAENPPRYWWRDNNPLNVGDFTGAGAGYASLEVGAVVTARVLLQPDMAPLADVLRAQGSVAEFSAAAHEVPWSASRYYSAVYIASIPVPGVITAP
jgi:hypothetical protein